MHFNLSQKAFSLGQIEDGSYWGLLHKSASWTLRGDKLGDVQIGDSAKI